MTPSYNMIAIIGPTATGKTSLAAYLSARIGGEVISADSRQVYRRMNLGTGKDLGDYVVNGNRVPFHLIDIVDPGYKYSVFEYQRDFSTVFADILSRGKMPVLCGGSGLYINAALRSYELPEVPRNEELRNSLMNKSMTELRQLLSSMKSMHNISDLDTPERTIRAIEIAAHQGGQFSPRNPVNSLVIGLQYDRASERARITERLRNRLEKGMVEEVKNLIGSGIPPETLLYYGLEYRYITRYLLGELKYSEMFDLLNTAIHQFAKRQRTWFRKMEREGTIIYWVNGELPPDKKMELIKRYLDS